uniref:Uncharacterized protein n=1 Tax=Arundo donax TaxID=35708 RepID=A0A0A9DIA1_ARUDO
MNIETFFLTMKLAVVELACGQRGLHVFKLGPSYKYLLALPLETSADCYLVPT